MEVGEAIKAVIVMTVIAGVVVLVAYLSLLFIPIGIVGAGWLTYRWYSELPSTHAARGRQKADALYQSLCELKQRGFPKVTEFDEVAYSKLKELMGDRLPTYELSDAYIQVATRLYAAERKDLDIEPLAQSATVIEVARYSDALAAVIRKFSASDIPNLVGTTVAEAMCNFCDTLPQSAFRSAGNDVREAKFSGSLVDMLPDAGRSVQELILPFY